MKSRPAEMFMLAIETSNAAFQDVSIEGRTEVARILRQVAKQVETQDCADGNSVRDKNGNTVCYWSWMMD